MFDMKQVLGAYGFSIVKSHLEDMFYSSKEILLLVKHNMSRSMKSVGEMHCTVLYVPRYWVGCRLQVSANRIKNYCLEDEYTHFGKIQFHSLRRAALSGTIHIRGLGVKAKWAPCPDACLCFSSVVSLQLLLPLPILSSRVLLSGGRWDHGQLPFCPTILPTKAGLASAAFSFSAISAGKQSMGAGVWLLQEALVFRDVRGEGTWMSCSAETAWTCKRAGGNAMRPTTFPSGAHLYLWVCCT